MPKQYQVPQFVEIEDKIIGPLTAKQFLMFVMAFLVIGAMWTSPMPVELTIILAVPIIIFTLLLAFYKVNGRSFVWFLYAVFHYFFTGKKFLWERRGTAQGISLRSKDMDNEGDKEGAPGEPAYNESRVKKLARILDTSGRTVDEDENPPPGFET